MSNLEEVTKVLSEGDFLARHHKKILENTVNKYRMIIKEYGLLKLGIEFYKGFGHVGISVTALSPGWVGHWHGLPCANISHFSYEPLSDDEVLEWVESQLDELKFNYRDVAAVQSQLF